MIAEACAAQARRQTEGIHDMAAYLAAQVSDSSHREVVGPLLAGTGASGVVRHRGVTVGEWGDPTVPEMLFSATKSVVSLVAGMAALDVEARVEVPGLDLGEIRWRHLLQQTSQWHGELWGKPTEADAQSRGSSGGPPGSGWAYNDVRVNLLCLALTVRFGRSLSAVLAEVMGALGASDTGSRDGVGVFAPGWVEESWRPCDVKPEYGYLWWLNDQRRIMPAAPVTGRAARGNGGRHLLWVDPARELVVASHWGETWISCSLRCRRLCSGSRCWCLALRFVPGQRWVRGWRRIVRAAPTRQGRLRRRFAISLRSTLDP